MSFELLQSQSLVVGELDEDGVVLLKERRRLELDDESSSLFKGINHSIVVSNGGVEGSNSSIVEVISFS